MVWLRWALAALMAAWATLFLLVVAYLGPLISLVLRTQEGVLTPGDSSLGGRLLWLELLGAAPVVLGAAALVGLTFVFHPVVEGRLPRLRPALTGAGVAAALTIGAITVDAALGGGGAFKSGASERERWEPGAHPRFDVMIVLDPADPATRQLVDDDLGGIGALDGMPPAVRGWDVAVGARATGAVEALLAPTHDPRALQAAAETLPAGEARSSPAALRRAVLAARGGRWRDGARRVVALLGTRLPRVAEPAAARAWRETADLLDREDVELVVIGTREPGGARDRPWERLLEPARRVVTGTDEPLTELLEAVIGVPDTEIEVLAFGFRPYLFLDLAERFRPIDIDVFLSPGYGGVLSCERRRFARDACDELTHSYELARHIGGDREVFLDIPGEERLGADAIFEDDFGLGLTSHRMYYHPSKSPDGSLLHLDYWWFFRYNVSPVATDSSCFAGLSYADRTCFDHEGDWEGVTVTLRRLPSGGWAPDSVRYAGHDWPGYRYEWPDLERAELIDLTTHPRVYVALGSHASYPSTCDRSGARLAFDYVTSLRTLRELPLTKLFDACQQLGRTGDPSASLPEGRHDGGHGWTLNDDGICLDLGCLAPLPMLPDDAGPARWNAFGGRWGRAECATLAHLCVTTDGPLSPFYQDRFDAPGGGVAGYAADLRPGGSPRASSATISAAG